MKVNIVTIQGSWILRKIADRIKENNRDKNVFFKVTHQEDPSADINFYVDLQNTYCGQKTNCDIAYFTHAHENSIDWTAQTFQNQGCGNLKAITSMNKRYTDMLIELGCPTDRIITLTPGETYKMFPLKKIVIGVCSRGGYPGYGDGFLCDLFSKNKFKNFEFKFLGVEWDNVKSITKKRRIKAEYIEDETYEKYPEFYKGIDYLLVPGLWTAGPMSAQEALSTGTPIIGANVGFMNYEFAPDYGFEPGDEVGLMNILGQIEKPLIDRRKQVEGMRHWKYTRDLVRFFKTIQKLDGENWAKSK